MSKKSVLLISANPESFPTLVYPLAIARLAHALKRAGHTVRQFDVLVHKLDSLPLVLEQTQPDLIGVSLRNIDNVDSIEPRPYIDEYRQLIDQLRAHSSAPIVIGGSAVSLFPRQLMSVLGTDFAIVGPGEDTLCQLLEAMGTERVANTPNLLTEDTENISTTFSPPSLTGSCHNTDIIDFYWRKGGMIGIQTKRGCPKKCTYCTYPAIDGSAVQYAAPEDVVDEMERLLKDHGVNYFFIVDSLFNISAEQEQAFAEEICRRSLKLSWGAFFSPSRMERDYISILKQSGLRHVEFGTDSLCDTMLHSYQKRFTVKDVMRTSSLCTDIGLFVAHYLIFGGPGESPETIRETVRNSHYYEKCVFFPFPGVRIYPRTALYETAVQEQIVSSEKDCLEPKFYFAPPLTAPMIWQILEEQLDNPQHWVLPRKSEMIRDSVVRLRGRDRKGPLWEYMLI